LFMVPPGLVASPFFSAEPAVPAPWELASFVDGIELVEPPLAPVVPELPPVDGVCCVVSLLGLAAAGPPDWIEGTTMSGKQNFAWYRFDVRHLAGPIFHAHGAAPVSSRGSLCTQCGKPYQPQRSDSKYCSDTCRQRAHRND
jgi:hypothetical protein